MKRYQKMITAYQNKNAKKYAASLAFTVLYAVFGLFFCRYSDIDNYLISIVANGLLGKNNFCTFVHPFLLDVIRFSHGILPCVDWFLAYTEFFVLAAVFFLTALWQEAFGAKGSGASLLFYSVWMVFLCSQDMLHANFTVVTGFLCCVSGILCCVYIQGKGKTDVLLQGGFVFFTACMIRQDSVFMLLPFFGVAYGVEWFSLCKDKKEEKRAAAKRRWMKSAAMLAVIFLMLTGWRMLVAYAPAYADGTRYSELRAVIADYPKLAWEEAEEQLAPYGITKNDYTALSDLFYMDTDRVNIDFLEKLAACRTGGYSLNSQGFLSAIRDLARTVILSEHVNYLLVLLLLLAGSIWVRSGAEERKTGIVCAFLGALLILFYFTIKGRAPERIWQVALMGVFMVCAASLTREGECKPEYRRLKLVFPVWGLAVLPVILGNPAFKPLAPEAKSYMEEMSRLAQASCLDNAENTETACFIWDVGEMDTRPYALWQWQGRLPSQEFLEHNIPDGEWFYGQSYFTQHLGEMGIPNPLLALAEREDVYYVCKPERCQIAVRWLYEHYDNTVTPVKVGEIYGLPVWKLEAGAQ